MARAREIAAADFVVGWWNWVSWHGFKRWVYPVVCRTAGHSVFTIGVTTWDPSHWCVRCGRQLATADKRSQRGSVRRALVLVVALLGLAGWGWSHGSRTPDGRWLFAVLIVAAALALVVAAGRRYVRQDRGDAAYTEGIEKRVRQDRSGAHYQDGA